MRSLVILCFSSLLLVMGTAATCAPAETVQPASAEDLRPILGPNDVIEVRVFQEKDLSGTHRVSDLGEIRVPLVGTLKVDGLTADEVQHELEKRFNANYLRDAQVTVIVKEFRSRQVFVLGQVNKPGPYPYDGRMTVIGAIAKAGGTTKLADANSTVVSRRDGTKTRKMRANVKDIRRGDAPDVELSPGDIIFVPESPF